MTIPRLMKTIQGPDLSIQLSNPSAPVYPGSVIRGYITRKSHIVAASVKVRVALIGYAAATVHDDIDAYYSTTFDFWTRNAVSQVAYRGPLHIASESNTAPQTWPFTLVVPLHTDSKALNAGLTRNHREASYLRSPRDPNGNQGLPEQPLPASQFKLFEEGRAHVEYYLEADLLLEGKKTGPIEATLPVRVSSRPAPALISDFELQGTTAEGCVTSHRLTPGLEHAKLTFTQKRQMFLGSKRVPTWHFNVRVECPSVVQLRNPANIPFRLKVIPDRSKTSKILDNVPQKVYLTSAALNMCGTWTAASAGPGEKYETRDTETLCLGRSETVSLLVPMTTEENSLDLSSLFGGLSLRRVSGLPDYTTYCLALTHALAWELDFDIAGEVWQWRGSQKVVVLPEVEGAANREAGGMTPVEAESSLPPTGGIDEPPPYGEPSESAPSYESVMDNEEGFRVTEELR